MARHQPHDRDRHVSLDARDTQGIPGPHDGPRGAAHRGRNAAGAGRAAAPAVHRRRGIAPWLVGSTLALVIAFALAHLVDRRRDLDPLALDGRTADRTTAVAGGTLAPAEAGAVGRFATWAFDGGNDVLAIESEASHPYTAEGVRLLADALAEAAGGRDVSGTPQRIAEVRAQAERLARSDEAERHSRYAHTAFVSASLVVDRLRGDRGRTGGELMAAANAIDPNAPLGPQGESVRRFFRAAADALRGR